MAVGMLVAAKQLMMCLLLACLASVAAATTLGSDSAASGLLQVEDAGCATLAMRTLLQQTTSQPPALATQEIPFAVRQMTVRTRMAYRHVASAQHQASWTC
jgi:hypothetical protein